MTAGAIIVIQEATVGTLATLSDAGAPWATPLHVFTDGTLIYWFSSERVRHSQNIERDPRVSLSVWTIHEDGSRRGVYVNGEAAKANEDTRAAALEIVAAKLGKVPDTIAKSTAYSLPLGEFDAGSSTSNCWYFYTQKV